MLTLALKVERYLSLKGANGFVLDKLGSDILNIKIQLKWCIKVRCWLGQMFLGNRDEQSSVYGVAGLRSIH